MPKYDTPISERHIYPAYNTPEIYKQATGEDAPAFNAGMKPKYWFDPKAREAAKTNPAQLFEYSVVAMKDGKPVLKTLELEAIDAGAVNIPGVADQILDATGQVVMPRAKVLDPVLPMLAGEELTLGPFGIPVFRNTAEYIKTLEAVDAFLASDREGINEKLDRILKKLGA